MNKLILVLVGLVTIPSAFAVSRCVKECTTSDGVCVEDYLGSRSAVLHLNAMLNAAEPNTAVKWKSSKCDREVNGNDGYVISTGAECAEKGPGNPKEGFSTSFTDEVSASMQDGSLVFNNEYGRAKMHFWAEGHDLQNEDILNVTRHKGHMIIEAGAVCYMIY